MNKEFIMEWEAKFGKPDLGADGKPVDLDRSMLEEKNRILRTLEELENCDWHFQEAVEGAVVFSDLKKVSKGGRQAKKVPQNVDELEKFHIYEQIRSVSMQVEYLRRASDIGCGKVLTLLLCGLLLLANDLVDLIQETETELSLLIPKAAISAAVLLVLLAVLFMLCRAVTEAQDSIYNEIKHQKRSGKQTLIPFQTKISSSVRASPADFATVLSNPYFYNNFRFESETSSRLAAKEEQALRTRKDEEFGLFQLELSKINDNASVHSAQKPQKRPSRRVSFSGEGSYRIMRDGIEFVMINDHERQRFLVQEQSEEVSKVFVLRFDEQRAKSGSANHLQVTQYTSIPLDEEHSASRGRRGLRADINEFMALRNVISFNCADPFGCSRCGGLEHQISALSRAGSLAQAQGGAAHREQENGEMLQLDDVTTELQEPGPSGVPRPYAQLGDDRSPPIKLGDASELSSLASVRSRELLAKKKAPVEQKEKPEKKYIEDYSVEPEGIYKVEAVRDWGKRIAGYTPEQQRRYAAGLEKVDEFFAVLAAPKDGWSTILDNKKKDLYCDQSTSKRGLPIIRARSHCNNDALTTLRYSANIEKRKKYDKNIADMIQHEKIGANLVMGYQRTHRLVTLAPRDLYNYCIFNIEESGRCWIVCWDAEGEFPETPGCVRMSCPLGGMLFTPFPDDPSKCHVDLVIEADARGFVPLWIFKHVISDSAHGLAVIREDCPKFYAEHRLALERDGPLEQQKDLDEYE